MSRWADTFAALSETSDTLDTMRHSGSSPEKVSQSVHSVTAPPESSAPSKAPADAPGEAEATTAERAGAVWGEAEAERAAIVEHDGTIPREWAEGFARLDPNRPPADVPLRRWQRFVDDVGLFLDGPFCAVAAALGWGPYDLFGCDRDRPFARIDLCGVLWLLNGHRLVMLAADAATIETAAGARQVWRRMTTAPGRLLAWELVA